MSKTVCQNSKELREVFINCCGQYIILLDECTDVKPILDEAHAKPIKHSADVYEWNGISLNHNNV
jgi:hypothetical protein